MIVLLTHFFNLLFLTSETFCDTWSFSKRAPTPPIIFLTIWLTLQWEEGSCNRCSPWIWQVLASLCHWLPGLGHKRQHSFLLGSPGMLTLTNSHHHAVKMFELAYVEKWMCKCFGGQPKSTTRHEWRSLQLLGPSQQVSTSSQVFPAKAQTSHLHTAQSKFGQNPQHNKMAVLHHFQSNLLYNKS